MEAVGVEVYGGALINSWLDRDLGIAGRVALHDGSTVDVVVDEPICRVPQLAIHLDRDVNDRGPGARQAATPHAGVGHRVRRMPANSPSWLADRLPATAATATLPRGSCACSIARAPRRARRRSVAARHRAARQPGLVLGRDRCDCAAAQDRAGATAVIALFDHEEVGSESTTGAAGPLLEHVLERLALAGGASRADFLTQLAISTCVSADNAHAVHPNYRERHDPDHRPIVNRGPAIKLNSNQRYATTRRVQRPCCSACSTKPACRRRCSSVATTCPCGTTIGPITATRLGIETVDVGVPQLSMHSARELCGVEDPISLADRSAALLQT